MSQLSLGFATSLLYPQPTGGAFDGIATYSCTTDSTGICSRVLESVKVRTTNHDLGLLHVCLETFALQFQFPTLESTNKLLLSVCHDDQIICIK
jgi:hypothetical protein